MELRDYLRILRRSAAIIVVLLLLGITGGAVATIVQTPSYEATAQDYVSIQSAQSAADLSNGVAYAQGVVSGYSKVAGTNYVLLPVIRGLRLNTTTTALAKTVTVTSDPESTILSVTVKNPSPQLAARIADAVAAQIVVAVDALTPQSQTGTELVRLTQIQPAAVPTTPASPSLPLYLGLGAAAGLVLAILIAIAREALDTRLREPADVARATEAPLLGEVLFDRRAGSRPVVVLERPRSQEAEALQTLRTNLDFIGLRPGRNVVVVTSARPGEGKTVTALNLAAALATSQRVIVVDADLRRPRVSQYLALEGEVGLTDVLIGRVAESAAVQRWAPGSFDVLPAGRTAPNAADLLRSAAMTALLDDLGGRYDVVIVDSPPLLAVSDAAVLVRSAAGALVVSAMRTTRRPELAKALARLSPDQVLGVVATKVRRARRDNYAYGDARPADGPGAPPVQPVGQGEPPAAGAAEPRPRVTA